MDTIHGTEPFTFSALQKHVAGKGMKKVHGQASGNKSQITIVACANAAGHCHPPMSFLRGRDSTMNGPGMKYPTPCIG